MTSILNNDAARWFCEAFGALDTEQVANDGLTWLQTDDYRVASRAAADAAGRGGPLKPVADFGQADLFAAMRGVDSAFAAINPRAAGPGRPAAGLLGARASWRQYGFFYEDPDVGMLLPRLTDSRDRDVPQVLRECFEYLDFVPAETARNLRLVRPRAGARMRASEREEGLVVGVVSFCDDVDELVVDIVDVGGEPHYRIALDLDEDTARTRIRDVIDGWETAGVDLGLVPEVMLTPGLLDLWKEALADGGGSRRPRWALVGTGNVEAAPRPTNTAVLLDGRNGLELARQSKRYGFQVTAEQQRRDYALPGFDGTRDIREDLHVEEAIHVVDLGAHRAVTLICEDLARAVALLAPINAVGASLITAPVFSKELLHWRWEQRAADVYAAAGASVVVVGNSAVLARLAGATAAVAVSLVHAVDEPVVVQRTDSVTESAITVVTDGEAPKGLGDVVPFP